MNAADTLTRIVHVGLIVLGISTCCRRAHAQDAGPTRPPMVMRGRSIDLRPDGLWSVPKPDGDPCTLGVPGCCQSDGEPDGGHCVESPPPDYREGTTTGAVRPAEATPDAIPTGTRTTRPPPTERPEGPTRSQRRAVWIVGILGAAFAAWLVRRRHVERTTELPGTPATIPPPSPPPATIPPPSGTAGLYPLRLPSRRREEADARAQHCDETRARIAALTGCRPADIRTEPNPHGQGVRAWIGATTWPQALAADDGLAVSWTLGDVPAALARLLVEVRRRRRAKS